MKRLKKFVKGTTSRGFKIIEFKDIYGHDCSIQASSLATKDAIWCGMDEGTHVEGQCCARMHLDRKLAFQIAAKLLKFAFFKKI